MANSSTTIAAQDYSNGVKIVTITFTADDADGSFDIGYLNSNQGRRLHSMVITPGATGPTANSDISVTDDLTTVNLVAANGVDTVDNATVSNISPDDSSNVITGGLQVAITNNSVNSAVVVVTLAFLNSITAIASTQGSLGVDDLITLSGVAEGATDLGTFTGTTITDSSTNKVALQELETAVEASNVLGDGTTSIVIGSGADANETSNISIGTGAISGQTGGGTTETDALAIGSGAKAYETSTIALGDGAVAGVSGSTVSPFSISIGYLALVDSPYGVALGSSSDARGGSALAIGYNSQALESESVCIGPNTIAGQTAGGTAEISTVAIGGNAKAYERYGIAIGGNAVSGQSGTTADPEGIAIGRSALSDQDGAVSVGSFSDSRGTSAVALGDASQALEAYCITIGLASQTGQNAGGTTEINAIAIGNASKAYETGGVAIGYLATVGVSGTSVDPKGIAIGDSSQATGANAVSIGQAVQNSNDNEVHIGTSNTNKMILDANGNFDLTTAGGKFIADLQTPASASAAGTAGMICADASYIYVCTATDTWKRIAIDTWA